MVLNSDPVATGDFSLSRCYEQNQKMNLKGTRPELVSFLGPQGELIATFGAFILRIPRPIVHSFAR